MKWWTLFVFVSLTFLACTRAAFVHPDVFFVILMVPVTLLFGVAVFFVLAMITESLYARIFETAEQREKRKWQEK